MKTERDAILGTGEGYERRTGQRLEMLLREVVAGGKLEVPELRTVSEIVQSDVEKGISDQGGRGDDRVYTREARTRGAQGGQRDKSILNEIGTVSVGHALVESGDERSDLLGLTAWLYQKIGRAPWLCGRCHSRLFRRTG